MGKIVQPAAVLFVVLSVVTGLLYPAVVSGLAQLVFPAKANGSLIVVEGKIVGSALIGQSFTAAKYFHGRPSATSPAYNALGSGGSNLGPTNAALLDSVRSRAGAFRTAYPPLH